MSANKNKITAQAQKFTAQGKFDKAIAEYEKIAKDDPSDIRTWLKMGDLFTRMGSRKDATATYIKVAEQYNKAGFHLKAVAVYKQILKIDPTLIEVYEMLSEAYLELGLTSEALIQLEQLADLYQRTDQSERMLAALGRMAELNPQNISTRLRIAEQHSRDGNAPAAVEQFRVACDQLREQGRIDDFLKVAERLLFHEPGDVDLAREAAGYYLESRHYKRALAKLQVCFSKDQRDVRTLELLAEAFVGLDQPDKSVSVYNEIANVIGDGGDQERRRRIHERILEIDPGNQAALAALGRAQSAPTRVLGLRDGLPSPAAAPAAAPPPAAETMAVVENLDELSDEEITSRARKIMNETEVLLKYGLQDRALDHLSKTFEFDYHNIGAREKMSEVLREAGREDEALEHMFELVDGFVEEQPEGAVYFLHRILDIDPRNRRALETLVKIGGVVPDHVGAVLEEVGEEAGGFELEVAAPGPEFDVPDDDLPGGIDYEEDTAQLDVFDFDAGDTAGLDVEEPGIETLEDDGVLIADDEAGEEEEVFDLDESLVEAPTAPAGDELSGLESILDLDDVAMLDEEPELELEPELEPEPAPQPALQPALPRPSALPRHSALPRPSALPRHSALPRPTAPSEAAHPLPAPARGTPPPEPAAKPPPAAAGDPPDISAEIEEIDFFISQELLDEARGVLEELLAEHPDDPRLARFVGALAGKPEPAPAPQPEPVSDIISIDDDDDALDFDQLADDLDQLVDDFAVEETATDPEAVGFEEVFSQFKAGVQAQISETDFATHYDLGQAYKEMGLFDDAIKEFELAAGDPGRRAQVAIMVGLCHLDAGRADEALEVLEQGMTLPDLSDDERLALKYEQAKVHESRGEVDRALGLYNELLIEDPGFADVIERIDALGG